MHLTKSRYRCQAPRSPLNVVSGIAASVAWATMRSGFTATPLARRRRRIPDQGRGPPVQAEGEGLDRRRARVREAGGGRLHRPGADTRARRWCREDRPDHDVRARQEGLARRRSRMTGRRSCTRRARTTSSTRGRARPSSTSSISCRQARRRRRSTSRWAPFATSLLSVSARATATAGGGSPRGTPSASRRGSRSSPRCGHPCRAGPASPERPCLGRRLRVCGPPSA